MGDAGGSPIWMKRWLIAAGVYNIAWGAAVVLFPGLLFDLTGMEPPRYPQIWQCVGMIVGVYGVGYLAASLDPRRHWPIVLVGLMGKVFGPIGFAFGVLRGELPIGFGATILTNDLIWWAPFSMILWDAAKHAGGFAQRPAVRLDDALATALDQHGQSLAAITGRRPTLVVLLRHSGCTFCKEALADLRAQRERIASAGLGVAVVTMSDDASNARLAGAYGLTDAHWVSDPQRRLYAALDVPRGTLRTLFGPRVWLRGVAATLRGHLIGRLDGDGFQMPGAFVISAGRVERAYRHAHAGDRLDHVAFACGV